MKGSARTTAARVLMMTAALSAGFATAALCEKAPKPAAPVKTVTLRVFSRVFHDFSEDDKVAMNEEFQIGDTDFTAMVFEYIPDFAMVMDSTNKVAVRVISRTNEPNNPAFHIMVKQKGVAQDTTWAFLNPAPHFARKSMLGFQVRRIDFSGHSPIVNKDKPPANAPAPGSPHGATGRKASQSGTPSPATGPTSRPTGGR